MLALPVTTKLLAIVVNVLAGAITILPVKLARVFPPTSILPTAILPGVITVLFVPSLIDKLAMLFRFNASVKSYITSALINQEMIANTEVAYLVDCLIINLTAVSLCYFISLNC